MATRQNVINDKTIVVTRLIQLTHQKTRIKLVIYFLFIVYIYSEEGRRSWSWLGFYFFFLLFASNTDVTQILWKNGWIGSLMIRRAQPSEMMGYPTDDWFRFSLITFSVWSPVKIIFFLFLFWWASISSIAVVPVHRSVWYTPSTFSFFFFVFSMRYVYTNASLSTNSFCLFLFLLIICDWESHPI